MRRLKIILLIGASSASACSSNSGAPTAQGGSGGQAGPTSGTGASVNGNAAGAQSMSGMSGGGSTQGGNSSPGAGRGGAVAGGASSGGSATGGAQGATSGASSSGGNGGPISGSAGAGGGSQGACAKAIFCEDFEKYEPGKAPLGVFKSQVSFGAISVDETRHVSGARSVKFTTDAKDGTKTAFLRLEGNSVFPVAGNAYYGRMMFFLESAPSTSVHWTLIQAGGTIAGQTYHAVYRYGGQQPVTENSAVVGNQLMANYETPDSYSGNGPRSDCWHHANKRVVPVGKWSCVEWKFDGPNNQMRLWLDGIALDDLSVNGVGQGCVSQPATYPWTAPTFEHLEVGWEAYQNDVARTLFIDDLVISKDPIGCP